MPRIRLLPAPLALPLLVLLAGCAAPPAAPGPSRVCDLAAASDLDVTRPADIPGTAPGKVDATTGVPACQAALAADPDNPRLKFQLARALYLAGEHAQSLPLYVAAAAQGHAIAANNAGVQYEKGQGTAKDLPRAERYFAQAARQGIAIAMRNLGEMLTHHETPAADAEATYWFSRAAEAGLSGGMVWYAHMLENGWGIRMDQKAALDWYRRGGEAGNTDGMKGQGVMLLEGRGGARDREQGLALLRRAAEMGNTGARKFLDDQEKAEARRRKPAAR